MREESVGRIKFVKTPRGYVRGLTAAAEYCGISDRGTVKEWFKSGGIRPRIINGQAFFKVSDMDRFMSPDSNPPGVEEEFWNGIKTAPAGQS